MEFTYVVGDIHGRLDLLDLLLAQIESHCGGRPRRFVFLGDYIDRGPQSSGVIERLRALEAADPEGVVCLAGNHEDILLRSLTDAEDRHIWMTQGGAGPTLASFDVRDVRDLPAGVLRWLEGLRTIHEDDLRYYVHAGLDPRLPVAEQGRAIQLWIRNDFLDVEHDFGKHVVHGHTPRLDAIPDVRRYRTNLDTAVSYGGRLTVGIFTNGRTSAVGYFQATQAGGLLDRGPLPWIEDIVRVRLS